MGGGMHTLKRAAVVYPRIHQVDRGLRVAEHVATRTGRLPIWCPVCGHFGLAGGFPADVGLSRDAGWCRRCGSVNRQRLLGHAIARNLNGATRRFASLSDVTESTARIYNAESRGPLHQRMSKLPGYVSSEYLGAEIEPGSHLDGLRHEDLTELSFPDEAFELVVSSDVLEHVGDPYRAHSEIYRILVDGGRHLFTVPFHFLGYRDEQLTSLDREGALTHLAEPTYHADPIRGSEGALVHTIFGLEMLSQLRDIGFVTFFYQLYAPHLGIIGDNALIFEAVKVPWGWA